MCRRYPETPVRPFWAMASLPFRRHGTANKVVSLQQGPLRSGQSLARCWALRVAPRYRLRPPRISSHSYCRLRLSKANLCLQDWFYSNGHSEFDLRHLLRIDYPDLHRLPAGMLRPSRLMDQMANLLVRAIPEPSHATILTVL